MSRFGVLRGDGLLRALSAHFELSETRVADDGLVRTRFYQKYGLLIRESVKLPAEETQVAEAEPKNLPEPAQTLNGSHSQNGLHSQNGAHGSNGSYSQNGSHSPNGSYSLNGSYSPNGSHVPFVPQISTGPEISTNGIEASESIGDIPTNDFGLNAEELLSKILGSGNATHPLDFDVEPATNGLEAHASELISLRDALRPPPLRAPAAEILLGPVERQSLPPREVEVPEWLVKSKRWSLTDLQEMLSPEDLAEQEPIAHAAHSPIKAPQVVYAVLSNKRVALIGFPEHQIKRLRAEFEAQFCHIRVLGWEDFGADNPDLTRQDVVVMRLEMDDDTGLRDTLASMDKPTLIVGDREDLIQLNPEFAGTPFDFVAHPCNPVEVVWRSANLLTRHSQQFEPAPVASGTGAIEDKSLPASVLIADDDPAAATLLYTALTSQGIECQVARDGLSALEAARRGGLGAVILETGLPGLDGFQIVAELKREPSLAKLRIMFLTARQGEADILRAFGLGADDYLTKPFSPMEVVARIKRLLERRP
jgi:CheY-like chemotaxis protein